MEPMYMLDPTARAEVVDMPALSGAGFRDQRVALVSNQWPSWDSVLDLMAVDLDDRFDAAASRRWKIELSCPAPDDVVDEVVEWGDVVLVGLAN
jgi:hypothetical protein